MTKLRSYEITKLRRFVAVALLAACGATTPSKPAALPTAETAPALRGATVLVFPVQSASVPATDPALQRWPADRAALDSEIAYWFQQGAPTAKWLLPETIDRTLARSPTLDINPRALAVGVFQHAQVRRIGDPLFGDLARLAAVLQARVAIVPVGAEFIGASPDSAVLNVATAVIDPTDGDVIWFGVITGKDRGVGSAAAIASAAQTLARTFSGHQPVLETNKQ